MKTSDSRHPVGIRTASAAAAVLGALALAGCGSSSSKAGPALSTPSVSSSLTGPSTLSTGDGSGDGAGGGTGTGDCTPATVKLTVSPVREPINHVLVTATNTSPSKCRLNGYPAVKYDPNQQAPVPPEDTTKPAQPVVLAPGASAYAGLMTSSADGSGHNGKDRPTISLQLAGAAAGSRSGSPASLPMPKGSQFVDDSAVVSYWVTDQQAALT